MWAPHGNSVFTNPITSRDPLSLQESKGQQDCLLGDASSADREVEQFYADEGPLSTQHPSVSLWEKCKEPRGHRVIALI